MKRYLTIFVLSLISIYIHAQKSYVNVTAIDLWANYDEGQIVILSGDVPSDMYKLYAMSARVKIGDILNQLSARGYEVEFMCSLNNGTENERGVNYLLSKNTSGSADSIKRVNEDGGEVREVARYNLQGLPVRAAEKGLQIVVYSNYTTKTILVQ